MPSWRWLLAAVTVALTLPLAGCQGDDRAAEGAQSVLRIALSADAPSLDPALASDTLSATLLLNLMDPLVRLDDALRPIPSVATRWDVSAGGTEVTYHLRPDARWTNGDPVTAADYEYAWKRALDPELASPYAYQFFGIAGAREYNACRDDARRCSDLAGRIGIDAVNRRTLRVRLTGPQPWFVAQSAHVSFLAVHRATVEHAGTSWTRPEHFVTNGPYRLVRWRHDVSLRLDRWARWRRSGSVRVERIEAKIIPDPTTALQAFEAGEVDACVDNACVPPVEAARLQKGVDYVTGPLLGTGYYGINVRKLRDVHVRRALALALDRRELAEEVTRTGERPATSFTPDAMPGFEALRPPLVGEREDLRAARAELARAQRVPDSLMLLYPSSGPAAEELAVATQASWQRLGLATRVRGMEFGQFLETLGRAENDVDVFMLGWTADFADDINFLELWTCASGNNFTGFCDRGYDRLVEQARGTAETARRHDLYGRAEAMLTGPTGRFPIIPVFWLASTTLRKPYVHGWQPNAMNMYDFTAMSVKR
jgi:oligopeptide transport system substrate-binding protein